MAKVSEGAMNVNCLRNKNGKVVAGSDGITAIWK